MAKKKADIPNITKALEFISLAQKEKGPEYQTHVALCNRTAVASDGTLSAGHIIDEEMIAFPHTITLLRALKKCTGVLSITQLDNLRLSVKGGRFQSIVPCLPGSVLPNIMPDPVAGIIDDRIRDGLAVVSPIIIENSQRVITASALIKSGSIVGTNGNVLIEYWHGFDIPPGILVPKVFINALCKITKKITSFGYSKTSFTVYFEDNSWLKTQLYIETYPDTDKILNVPTKPVPLPPTFFEGVDTLLNMTEEHGRLFLTGNLMRTSDVTEVGSTFEVDGMNANAIFTAKNLKLVDGIIKTIDINGVNGVTYFFADNIRGAITQVRRQ